MASRKTSQRYKENIIVSIAPVVGYFLPGHLVPKGTAANFCKASFKESVGRQDSD